MAKSGESISNFEKDFAEDGLQLTFNYLDFVEELLLIGELEKDSYQQADKLAVSLACVASHLNKCTFFLKETFQRDLNGVNGPVMREINGSTILMRGFFQLFDGYEVMASVLDGISAPFLEWWNLQKNVERSILDYVSLVLSRLEVALSSLSWLSPKQQLFFQGIGGVFHLLGESLVEFSQTTHEKKFDLLSSIFCLRFLTPMLCDPIKHHLVLPSVKVPLKSFRNAARVMQAVANNRLEHVLDHLPEDMVAATVGALHCRMVKIMQIIVSLGEKTNLDLLSLNCKPLDEALEVIGCYRSRVLFNLKYEWKPVREIICERERESRGVKKYLKAIRAHQKKAYGFVLSPLEPHSAIPELFGVLWSAQYEIAAVESHVSALTKEMLQAAVSMINGCQLCVELHTTAAMGMGLSYSTISSLIKGKSVLPKGILTSHIIDIVSWGRVSNVKDHPSVRNLPFSPVEIPEICATAFLKHYFNRITNSFLSEFTKAKGRFFKSKVMKKKSQSTRTAKKTHTTHPHASFSITSVELSYNQEEMTYTTHTNHSSDQDLSPEPSMRTITSTEADLNEFVLENLMELSSIEEEMMDDFHWAKQNGAIYFALKRWDRLEGKLGRECLPPIIIDRLHQALADWNGTFVSSEHEIEKLLADLPLAEQTMLKLVITIAQNPQRVSSHLRNQFRALFSSQQLGSNILLGACSYAAFLAAKRVSSFWGRKDSSSSSSSSQI